MNRRQRQNTQPDMEYKLKQRGENDFDSVIEISGLSSDHTINSLLDHLENTQRMAKETDTRLQMDEMFVVEALKKMPQLAEIPSEHLPLAIMYFAKLEAIRTAKDLLATCEDTIGTYTTHLKAIEEATGITCLPVIAPFQREDIAGVQGVTE